MHETPLFKNMWSPHLWAGTKPRFEHRGAKHEPKKFQVTWSIKKKNHGRQNNCTLLP